MSWKLEVIFYLCVLEGLLHLCVYKKVYFLNKRALSWKSEARGRLISSAVNEEHVSYWIYMWIIEHTAKPPFVHPMLPYLSAEQRHSNLSFFKLYKLLSDSVYSYLNERRWRRLHFCPCVFFCLSSCLPLSVCLSVRLSLSLGRGVGGYVYMSVCNQGNSQSYQCINGI